MRPPFNPPFAPTKPTHRLKLKDPENGRQAEVGAAWLNADGSMTVHLNPGVTLSYESTKGKMLTVFPISRSAVDE